MGKYVPGHIIRSLQEALESSRLEHANFATICPEDKYPTNEKEADAFIKGRVRLHYQSWIESPLENAIEALNEFNEQARKKR